MFAVLYMSAPLIWSEKSEEVLLRVPSPDSPRGGRIWAGSRAIATPWHTVCDTDRPKALVYMGQTGGIGSRRWRWVARVHVRVTHTRVCVPTFFLFVPGGIKVLAHTRAHPRTRHAHPRTRTHVHPSAHDAHIAHIAHTQRDTRVTPARDHPPDQGEMRTNQEPEATFGRT